MGKGFGCGYKKSQSICPYKSTNTIFSTACLLFISQHDSTNYYGVTVIDHKKTLPLSNLTTTTKDDTDSKSDDDTPYFPTPEKIIESLKYLKK